MNLGFSEKHNGESLGFEMSILTGVKIHTFRVDKKGRWKAGRVINFIIGNRTKRRREFMRGTCTSTQRIVIRGRKIIIDGNVIHDITAVAINDGLKDADSLIKYFNGRFAGWVIHWTNFKY